MGPGDIKTDRGLADLSTVLLSQPVIALDTEFIGERTYWAKLALVQVSYPNHSPVLIDPLEISDWAPFHRVLSDPGIVKIFHAGRQDVEIFFHQMGQLPRNVFDTQIAASLCGYGAQIGYADLVKRIVGDHLDKNNTFSDWLQRPLTVEQTTYARDDVRYLCRIYEVLTERLDKLGRSSWVDAEMRLKFSRELFVADPEKQWIKVKRHKTLEQRHWVVMKDLAAWRLSIAQRLNRPVRFVLSDEALVEASRIDELEIDDLKGRVFARFSVAKFGAQLVRLHKAARLKPKSEWPQLSHKKPTVSRDVQLQADLAWVIVQSVARRHRVAPSKIINKRDLPALIQEISTNHSDRYPQSMKGWRWSLIGPTLQRLVAGDLDLGIRNGSVVWQRHDAK